MLQHPQHTRRRVQQLVERLRARIHPETLPVRHLEISPPVERISYAAAQELPYSPVAPGRVLGPQWTTYWIRGSVEIPPAWRQRQVDLLWDSHSEATLWLDGRPAGGINPGRDAVPLPAAAVAGGTLRFQVEVACNGLFGAVARPYASLEPFVLDRCAIALFDRAAWDLYYDLLVLSELEAEPDLGADWRGRLLAGLNEVANALDETDATTWAHAQRLATALLAARNASCCHQISAIGHAHIDTAWLWPLEETWRKCTRTFSTAVLYMDLYPEYRFACSQAVQYAAMKERQPELYRRMREKVAAGQWVPVGGTWVEPDCNIPSGESLCRQFLFGQRFFEQEFGRRCREFWNPDVFGYNGQLPQIMRQAGVEHFLTQKLSWNAFNKPMHQTFAWEGIDGTSVLTHFPPSNTYNANCTVEELRRSVREYRDNDRSGHSCLLFGVGDGGGGPTRDMLERLRRARDLQGLPRTEIRPPSDFFARLEADCTDLPRVVGELYFELHRGTYTTQAAIKRANRKAEILLHDVEFLATLASRLTAAAYPKADIDALWRLLLTNQFHDILPGSSITQVYQDAARDHAEIQARGSALKTAALAALGTGASLRPTNTTSFARREVAARPDGRLVFVEVPAYGVGDEAAPPGPVAVARRDDTVVLENDRLRAVLRTDGTLASLQHRATGREALAGPANQLVLYDDHPTAWDAWEIDAFALETGRACAGAATCAVVSESPLRGEVEFTRRIGKASAMTQRVRLDAGAGRLEFYCAADWHESDKMLKVAFPVQVRAETATYEMQFGHVARPTHYNTSFDLARFEVPGHRWVDLSEHRFGVALLTDCKYGYHTVGGTMHITLLRAPKSPDPVADMGHHEFAYAVLPHAGAWQDTGVVAEAASFNTPLVWAAIAGQARSFLTLDSPDLVLDTVKRAEDSEAVVLRLYEAHGARGTATLRVGFPVASASLCNILEDRGAPLTVADQTVRISYRPHQLLGIMLH